MCLAIVLAPNVDIPEDNLRRGFLGNDHGAGYGFYKSPTNPVLNKGFLTFEEFFSSFKKEREENKDKTFLVHFRIRSSGAKSKENCHPFQLKHGMLIHNGTVWGLGTSALAGKSDTAEFAEIVRKVAPSQFKALGEQIRNRILGNRVAVLTKEGEVVYMGSPGEMIDGVWYSNTHWKPYTTGGNGWRSEGRGWLDDPISRNNVQQYGPHYPYGDGYE